MVVGDDDLDAGRPGGAYRLHRGDAAVAGDDQPGAQTARLGEPGRPEVVPVAQPVRDERVDPAADAREYTREERRGTLAVHVVVAVDQDRGTRPEGGDDQLDRPRHIGPGVWIREPLEVRAEERFGELGRGQPALHGRAASGSGIWRSDARAAVSCGSGGAETAQRAGIIPERTGARHRPRSLRSTRHAGSGPGAASALP